MAENVWALLVHSHPDPLRALKVALERQAVKTKRARSCREVTRHLSGKNPPHLIFTDPMLPDGTWQDMIRLAATASVPVNVIVVSRVVDIRLYLEALEGGAYDFITPPFASDAIAHVARCAMENARQREAAQAWLKRHSEQVLTSPLFQPGL